MDNDALDREALSALLNSYREKAEALERQHAQLRRQVVFPDDPDLIRRALRVVALNEPGSWFRHGGTIEDLNRIREAFAEDSINVPTGHVVVPLDSCSDIVYGGWFGKDRLRCKFCGAWVALGSSDAILHADNCPVDQDEF
jgi:hypothetical protein